MTAPASDSWHHEKESAWLHRALSRTLLASPTRPTWPAREELGLDPVDLGSRWCAGGAGAVSCPVGQTLGALSG